MTDNVVNPYQPPSATEALGHTGGGKRLISDVRPRCYLILGAIGLSILFVIVGAFGHHFLGKGFRIRPASGGLSPARFCVVIGILSNLVYITCFFAWIFRSARNARMLGSRLDDINPGMAVGSFFIPVFNLFGPMIAMRKISAVFKRLTDGADANVGIWWAVWITSSIFFWVPRASGTQTTGLYWCLFGSECLSKLFTAFLVIRLTAQQTQLFLNPPASEEPAPWAPGVAPMRVRPALPPRPMAPGTIPVCVKPTTLLPPDSLQE